MKNHGRRSKRRENKKVRRRNGGADVGRIKHSRTNNILKAKGRRAPPHASPRRCHHTTRQKNDYYLGCLHTPPAPRQDVEGQTGEGVGGGRGWTATGIKRKWNKLGADQNRSGRNKCKVNRQKVNETEITQLKKE